MTSANCQCDSASFTATAVYTGENRLVRVQGACQCPTPGYVLTLTVDNPGVNPEPNRLKLVLSETEPDGVQPEVITPGDLDETFDVSPAVKEVGVRRSGGTGFVLSVTEPT